MKRLIQFLPLLLVPWQGLQAQKLDALPTDTTVTDSLYFMHFPIPFVSTAEKAPFSALWQWSTNHLGTANPGGPNDAESYVHWENLKGVPAGFADGVDNDSGGGGGISWVAAGDLAYGTGSGTYAILSAGTASQILRMNSGATAQEWFTLNGDFFFTIGGNPGGTGNRVPIFNATDDGFFNSNIRGTTGTGNSYELQVAYDGGFMTSPHISILQPHATALLSSGNPIVPLSILFDNALASTTNVVMAVVNDGGTEMFLMDTSGRMIFPNYVSAENSTLPEVQLYSKITDSIGMLYHAVDGQYETPLLRHNLAAAAAPTAGDDQGDGYFEGSLWVDTSNDDVYKCIDNSTGAAIWQRLGEVLLAGSYDYITSAMGTSAGIQSQTITRGQIDLATDVTGTLPASAGALMDSEVDADLKTLSLPASTTISSFGATLVDDADAAAARTTLGVDAAGTANVTLIESFSLESPTVSDKVPWFRTDVAITITEVVITLIGSSTPSVTVDLRHGTDLSAAGTALITSPSATTNTSTGNAISSFDDATLAANEILWFTADAVSGTVDWINITLKYTED